ncbi:MAG: radical SAM protein, partial [Planctomycetota bacterium]
MDLLGKTPAEWATELAPHGTRDNILRAVRAVYRGETAEPWRLPDLGARLAGELERRGLGGALPPVLSRSSSEDGAEKLLVATASGAVEAVLIPDVRLESSKEKMRRTTAPAKALKRPRTPRPRRAAGCISTQVGCAVGCTFCASGLLGLAKNLTAAELVAQVLLLRAAARERGILLTTLVFTGMGEPLHNTDALLRALELLTDYSGGEMGPGTLTVSTVGVVPGIERLAALGRRAPNLALSLHAPDDATRARIIPMKNLASAREALDAARAFARATRRFVTVSYVLLDGVNDAPEQADALAALVEGTRFHVNLIPWNSVPGIAHAPSRRERAQD